MTIALSLQQQQQFFAEDDEEIWKTLVSLQDGDSADLTPLLTGLSERLQEDWCVGSTAIPSGSRPTSRGGEEYWKYLVGKLARDSPFVYSDASSQPLNTNTSSSSDVPAAFQTDAGKKHLAAASALLGISERRALQVTLGALRSVDVDRTGHEQDDDDKKGSDFSVLLGSRDLLVKTVMYHYQQRLARLSVLTECLRLEQDPDTHQGAAIVQFLDSLDNTFSHSVDSRDGSKTVERGIFKCLLIVSCQPDPKPSRAALEPSKALQAQVSTDWGLGGDLAFSSFAATLIAEDVAQVDRERTHAMEGLLALLYGERMQGGIFRCDYGLWISAVFDDTYSSGTQTRTLSDARWKQLAGLICAEFMTLWKLMEQSLSESGLQLHPMLNDIDSDQGKAEIESLIYSLARLTDTSSTRSSWMKYIERPEALAVMSFGLLLCLSADVSTASLSLLGGKSLRDYGSELVQLASEQGRAFDYLSAAVIDLTGAALAVKPISVKRDFLYDWQFSKMAESDGNDALMLKNKPASDTSDGNGESAPVTDLSADIVAYTSIAREVLAGSIAAFSETVLNIDNSNSCHNIGMLCELAATIYKNNASLGMQFWDSWDDYLNQKNNSCVSTGSRFPICRLLDGAHKLASATLDAFHKNQVSTDFFVAAVAPFFRLLSSLCCTPSIIETIVGMIPRSMFRLALLCCGGTSRTAVAQTDASSQCRISILQSFGLLARVSAESKSCLDKLRLTIEEDVKTSQYDGPRVLARIIANDQVNSHTARAVLHIFGHLLDSAPAHWGVLVSRHLLLESTAARDSTPRLATFVAAGNEELSHSAVIVLAGLINHVNAVCSEDLLHPGDALKLLQSVAACLLSAMTSLGAFTSTGTAKGMVKKNGMSCVSSQKAESILQSFANFFKWIRPLTTANGHLSEGAVLVRDNLVQSLANNDLCAAIIYYAVAPVSYSVVLKMEDEIRDSKIIERVAQNGDVEAAQKFGAWASLSSTNKSEARNNSLLKSKICDFILKMSEHDFDFLAIQSRGWSNNLGDRNGFGVLRASWAALRLLSEWISHVEDIACTHMGNSEYEDRPLSGEAAKIVGDLSPHKVLFSLAPPPIPCRSDNTLSVLWHEMGLSTFELLLPFLQAGSGGVSDVFDDTPLPSSVLLDFLAACVVHANIVDGMNNTMNAPFVGTIFQSASFKGRLTSIVKNGIGISNLNKATENLTGVDINCLSSTFLSLRILDIGFKCGAGRGARLFDTDLLDLLLETSLQAKEVLDLSGHTNLLTTSAEILQMRMSGACLSVLASLWKIVRRTKRVITATEMEKYADEKGSFVAELADIISAYSNSRNLDDRIPLTTDGESGRIGMMLFMSSALQILASEFATESRGTNDKMCTSDLLNKFTQSRRFMGLDYISIALNNNKQFCALAKSAKLDSDPTSLFRSFPSMSTRIMKNDFYWNENRFDLRSCFLWLAGSDGQDAQANTEIQKTLHNVSLPNHLVAAELSLMESWGSFLTITAYDIFRKNDSMVPRSCAVTLLCLARDTLASLGRNLRVVCEKMSDQSSFETSKTIVRMTKSLGKVLLFVAELGVFKSLPFQEILAALIDLAEVMDYLHNFISQQPVGHGELSRGTAKTYCTLQANFIGCAVLLCDSLESKSPADSASCRRDVYANLCLMNCKYLQVFVSCCDVENASDQGRNCAMIRLCSSLFTLILCSDAVKDLTYLGTISGILRESTAIRQLMQLSVRLSLVAARTVSLVEKPDDAWVGDSTILATVNSVFVLLHSITETNSPELVSLLSCLEFSQLVVRNSLFRARTSLWLSQQGSNTAPTRGYMFQGKLAAISNQNSSLLMGTDDPVYGLWLTAMHILEGSNRTLSDSITAHEIQRIRREFVAISVEFLDVYKDPLLVSLKSCSCKLTRNILREATVFLSLMAELSKRSTRDLFTHSCKVFFDEVLEHTKFVVSTLSRFVGAAGSAQELFRAIQEYESLDTDAFEEQALTPLRFPRARLVSEGLSSAKHEAIKFSHYASGRTARITKYDFETSTTVPGFLKDLSMAISNENDLERNCRLAVTSHFSLDLTRLASQCLFQAMSLIWRTHSITSSFYRFTRPTKRRENHDLFHLVRPGIVVGYRSVGALEVGGPMGFLSLRLGKVIKVDTFSQTWEVSVLRDMGSLDVVEGVTEIISPAQLSGAEDKSSRKTPSQLEAAPDTMSTFEDMPDLLTTGNYILILRWCHQQVTLNQGSAFDTGFEAAGLLRQIAEQAAVLLAADLVLHDLNGHFKNKEKKEVLQLDNQMFELFADKDTLASDLENAPQLSTFSEGRLKELISPEVWTSIQQQVQPFVARSLKEKLENEDKQKQLVGMRRVRRRGSFGWR